MRTFALVALMAVAAAAARPMISTTPLGSTMAELKHPDMVPLHEATAPWEDVAEPAAENLEAVAALEAAAADVESAFEAFMAEHGHAFEGEEKQARMAAFEANIALALENNKNDPTAMHGINLFSHLTPAEFKKWYTASPADVAAFRAALPEMDEKPLPDTVLPYIDWVARGAVTPVKNQGQCGSCWAFSATGAMEGATFVRAHILPNLSEQHLVDCDHTCLPDDPSACDSGCEGGLPINAMTYAIANGGIDTEDSYPYEGVDGDCRASSGTIGATIKKAELVPANETQMVLSLIEDGPLSIGINAEWMQTYLGGVSCPLLCDKEKLDHGVLITGFGRHSLSPIRLGQQPFWEIKNSWGPAWGEKGYIKVCRGKDICGITGMVTAVTQV